MTAERIRVEGDSEVSWLYVDGECTGSWNSLGMAVADVGLFSIECSELRSRIAELEADNRRLDWVIKNKARVIFYDEQWNVDIPGKVDVFTGMTYQEAIDKAMA